MRAASFKEYQYEQILGAMGRTSPPRITYSSQHPTHLGTHPPTHRPICPLSNRPHSLWVLTILENVLYLIHVLLNFFLQNLGGDHTSTSLGRTGGAVSEHIFKGVILALSRHVAEDRRVGMGVCWGGGGWVKNVSKAGIAR